MYGLLCSVVLITPADVNFAWATVQNQPCKCDVSAVAFAWANVKADGCTCGADCPCCVNGGCKCKAGECKKLDQREVYAKYLALAIKDGKPLVVSVNCEPVKVSGCYSCRWDAFPDPAVREGIVVGVPTRNTKGTVDALLVKGPLTKDATISQIASIAFPNPPK